MARGRCLHLYANTRGSALPRRRLANILTLAVDSDGVRF